MTILYSAIAKGTIILVSHQEGNENFENLTESMLKNIPSEQSTKITYTSDNYLIHVVIKEEIIYLCIADVAFGRRVPYAFLEEISSRFGQSTLAMRAITARHHELDRDFEFILKQEMVKYSAGETGDNISKLQSQVNEVKDVMIKNVDKVLERGENLNVLLSKTSDLEESASIFQNTSRKVHRKMKWKNYKMIIIIVSIILVILTIIILFATGVIKT